MYNDKKMFIWADSLVLFKLISNSNVKKRLKVKIKAKEFGVTSKSLKNNTFSETA